MKEVVVLGGGAAGWYTAMFLKRVWRQQIRICVIESPRIPPIIAGESGSLSNMALNSFLDIDEDAYIRECSAFPKLGSKFVDWSGVGTEFIHPAIERDIWSLFNNEWHHQSPRDENAMAFAVAHGYLSKIFSANTMINECKIPYNDKFERQNLHMFHFDSRGQAEFLKKVGQEKYGIKLIVDEYESCSLTEDGCIESVTLTSGKTIKSDWVFDCSGFAKLLLKKVMNAPFKDYTDVFPCDSVVAWWNYEQLDTPYTTATCMKNGWSWCIPLNGRTGNGYLYDSSEITVEEAIAEAEERFGKKIEPVAKLKFKSEFAEEFWVKNVIGVGLSTGFIEPLESNGLGIVVDQLFKLQRFWSPNDPVDSASRMMYNQEMFRVVEVVIAFLSLHYQGKRDDSKFWKKVSEQGFIHPITKRYLDVLSNGSIDMEMSEKLIYPLESLVIVADGLGLVDRKAVADRLPPINFQVDWLQQQEQYAIKSSAECIPAKEWVKRL